MVSPLPLLSPKEYLLWREKSWTSSPWKRQYLNVDFLEWEKKVISDLSNWRVKFLKAKENESLEESIFFVIPINPSPSWKVTLEKKGEYFCTGLSALQDSPQIVTLALFNKDEPKPLDYQRIRIISSKKINLLNEKDNYIQDAMLVENWELLDGDSIYLDLNNEKKYVSKILMETLTADKTFSESLQAPIIGSQYLLNRSGVALSGYSMEDNTSKKLSKVFLKMVPPEYRSTPPPKALYEGTKDNCIEQFNFSFATRPYNLKGIVGALPSSTYKQIYEENNLRSHNGKEYSFFSPLKENILCSSNWMDLMNKFSSTEITLSKEFSDFTDMINWDKLEKSIDEDLWASIANSRQKNPTIDNEVQNKLELLKSRLISDIDVLLPDKYKDEQVRKNIVQTMAHNVSNNLPRVAISLARSKQNNFVEESDLENTRNLIVDNFHEILEKLNNGSLGYALESQIKNSRVLLIRNHLLNHGESTILEIWDEVKVSKYFSDQYDLAEELQKMRLVGAIVFNNLTEKYYLIE